MPLQIPGHSLLLDILSALARPFEMSLSQKGCSSASTAPVCPTTTQKNGHNGNCEPTMSVSKTTFYAIAVLNETPSVICTLVKQLIEYSS